MPFEKPQDDERLLNPAYKYRSESKEQISFHQKDHVVQSKRGREMKTILLTLTSLAALALTAPALALAPAPTPAPAKPVVDHATVNQDADCVLTAMTDESQTAVMAAFVDKKSGDNDLMTKATQGVADAAQVCIKDQQWSETRADHAYGLAVTSLFYQAAVNQAKAAGIDADGVENWFDTQDEPFRTTYATDHMKPNRYDAETERMVSELDLDTLGTGKAGDQKLVAVATLVATLVLVTRASMALEI
jgi:hypothetical protein